MATVQYQCDTCKREIELLENARGLTMYNSCVITEGCRGKLYKLSRNAYNFREAFAEADPADDLDNFSPRKVFFRYNQEILSDRWIIKHNLNARPVVKVFVESEDEASIDSLDAKEFTVTNNSADELEIIFNGSFTGQAHLIARSISEDSVETIPPVESLTQISYQNTLSFAVISRYFSTGQPEIFTNGTIQLDIILEEPNEEPIFCTETFEGLEAGLSPWNNFGSILFRRRRNFNVKTKDIREFRVIKDRYNSLSDIPQLTRLTISKINLYPPGQGLFQEVKSKQLLLLLANSPYDKADKNLDQVIDIGEVNQQTENTSFVFIDGVLYSDPGNVEKVYPKIEKDSVIAPAPSNTPTPTSSATPTPTPTSSVTPTPTPSPTPSLAAPSLVWVDTTSDWDDGGGLFNGTCFEMEDLFFGNATLNYSGSGISPVFGWRVELTLTGGSVDEDVSIDITTDAGSNGFQTVTLTNGVPFVYELDENSGVFDGVSGLGSAYLYLETTATNYETITICNIEVLTLV